MERLTYAPAVEWRYLVEMAELDQVEFAATSLSLRGMELSIKHTSELKVLILNYKKTICSPDAEELHKKKE
jgi:hypothetical protein